MISSILSLALITNPSQASTNLTLLSQGEARGGYKTYGLVDLTNQSAYRRQGPSFNTYSLIPELSALSATLSANGRKLTIDLGNFMAVNQDFSSIQRPEGKIEVPLSHFADTMTLHLSDEFQALLTSLKEKFPGGSLQADDRRDQQLKLYEAKFSKMNFETLSRSLSILYRAAVKKNMPFKLYIYVTEDNGIELGQLSNLTLLNVELGLQEITRNESKVTVNLPPLQDWTTVKASKVLTFYDALKLMDQHLLEYLDNDQNFALKAFPETAWRRDLLESALGVYFEDPEMPHSNTCDSYNVRVKDMNFGSDIEVVVYWPTYSKILIPHRVARTEQL